MTRICIGCRNQIQFCNCEKVNFQQNNPDPKLEKAYKDGLKMKALNEAANKHMIQWNPESFVKSHPKLLRSIFEAMDIYKGTAKRVSGDGVFFKCSQCSYEPDMEGTTSDLLKMNHCPNCGHEFL